MHEFWYDYVKPKYGEKAKFCYINTDSFIVYRKTDYIYSNISKDVETRFDTLNYESDEPLSKGKNKNIIGFLKDELDEKIIKRFSALRAKTYSYLTDNKNEGKKAKGTKKCVVKKHLNLKITSSAYMQLNWKQNKPFKMILMWITLKEIIKNS